MRHPALPASDAVLLQVRGATVQYRTDTSLVTATYRVDFEARSSDRYVILGASGCGKSTLLKAIGGYVGLTEGEILLDGRAVSRPGPDRVMVFQEFDQLLPWKTVLGNIVFALREGTNLGKAQAKERALHYLEKVGLTRFVDAYPHMLSGGMKARVAIARGMAMEPAILLMDEPFAALDALTRRRMQDELLELWEGTRFTVLFVTHAIDEAVRIGNRILLLSPHPGQVMAELASDGRDLPDPQTGEKLSETIHRMLFGEARVESACEVHA
ncbi:MAG: transporter [Rhizobacter sp.]|nr:transporter [Rhizobacter sp.]